MSNQQDIKSTNFEFNKGTKIAKTLMARATKASTSEGEDEEDECIAEFEALVARLLTNRQHLSETEIVDSESNLVRYVSRIASLSLTDRRRRKLLADWLNLVGLSALNIRHLEICGLVDFSSLIATSARELRSLADRGRFSADSKRRLLRSSYLITKYNQSFQADKGLAYKNKDLSWSYGSPSMNRKKEIEDRKSSSASPPCDRVNSERRRTGATSVDSDTQKDCDFVSTYSSDTDSYLMCSSSTKSPSAMSSSLSTSVFGGICSSTLSPVSPTPTSSQSTPSLGVGSRVVQSTSMQFGAPKSPKTSRLVHAIPHKWHRSTKFRFSGDAACHFCTRPLGFGFLNAWEKCRSCKWKVHTQCKNRVGDSCGLTPDHLRVLFDKLIQENNGGMWNDPQSAVPLPGSRSMHEPAFQYPDTAVDSSSSTNSSAPSTPAPLGIINNSTNPLTAPYRTGPIFFGENVPEQTSNVPILVISEGDVIRSDTKEDGEITLGEGSEGTLIGDSTGSNTDAAEGASKSAGLNTGHNWDRHTWNMSTIRGPNAQASWNEVTIPFENIEFGKNALIGRGRFGRVLRGYHFGDVAVKMLDMEHIEESKRIEEFKAEVSAHKNTRHDNIVLFLGYCMEADNLGIVMSLCKGRSLHALLREQKERIDLPSILAIAQQICQGVSYLHTKKILHKDLRSKNIFIENKANKVVITDFGLFSTKRLKLPLRSYGVSVPKYWLSYQAPEMIRALDPSCNELPFSESSDVYAFGTIWYELLTSTIPLSKEPWARIVWMVGHGLKAPIRGIECNREMKDLLLRCWNFEVSGRPSFIDIQLLLSAFPKKRLDRSPSFPVMRSYESTF